MNRTEFYSQIEAIQAPHEGTVRDGRYIEGPPYSAGERERLDNLERGLARLIEREDAEREAELAPRRAALGAAVLTEFRSNPMSTAFEPPRTAPRTASSIYTTRQRLTAPEYGGDAEARTAALRTIEAHRNLDAAAADRLEEVVRRPASGPEARYIAAVGAPAYLAAFAKVIANGDASKLWMTAEEEQAWDAVNLARDEQRASLTLTTGAAALPFDLDPTMTNISAGANCPLRRLARVQVITQNTRHFVNANGVVAVYQAEGATTTEAAPTLTSPSLTVARGGAAISASFEVLQDVEGLVTDLAALIADGRDTVDATKFLTGSGTNEPLGILTVGTTGALTTTQRVQSTTADVVVPNDVHRTYNAISPRFQAQTAWVGSPTTYSVLYQMTPPTSSTNPMLIPEFGGPLLAKPFHPWSTMANLLATGEQTGNKVLVGGDWANGVTIGDRIGMQLEIIPNAVDTTTGFPTGQRIFFGWWRTGVVVHNVNALRYLELS